MSQKMKCRIVTWDEIYVACKKLAADIENSGYQPETIIGLARSGFVPSRLLSDFMGVTDLVCLKVEHWLDTTGQHKEEATIPYRIPFRLKDRKVIVVDDIVDTGKSMVVSLDYVKKFEPKEIRTAVMQYVVSAIYIPDYYAVKVDEWSWFIYPWNLVEDLSNLTCRFLKEKPNSTLKDIKAGLEKNHQLKVDINLLEEIISTLQKRSRIEKTEAGWKAV